jgi:hypothetical protein
MSIGYSASGLPAMSPALSGAPTVNGVPIDALGQMLTTGHESLSRLSLMSNIVGAGGSGRVGFTYFTGRRAETVNNIAQLCGTAAAAGLTLARMGLYTVAANGNLALVAACASDTSLFNAANTLFTRTLAAPYAIIPGQRYALANIQVGATPSDLTGLALASGAQIAAELQLFPHLMDVLLGQGDLPATVNVVALSGSTNAAYGRVFP